MNLDTFFFWTAKMKETSWLLIMTAANNESRRLNIQAASFKTKTLGCIFFSPQAVPLMNSSTVFLQKLFMVKLFNYLLVTFLCCKVSVIKLDLEVHILKKRATALTSGFAKVKYDWNISLQDSLLHTMVQVILKGLYTFWQLENAWMNVLFIDDQLQSVLNDKSNISVLLQDLSSPGTT